MERIVGREIMLMPTASLSLFPLPIVNVSLPSRCDGTLPNGRRCMVRGTRRVAGGLYCRHHVPTRAIRFDAVQGMRDGARMAGAGIESPADTVRLKGQLAKIWAFCLDGQEHTVAEIAAAVDAPENSVQANLRNLRKVEFGGHQTPKRRVTKGGLFVYKLIPNPIVQLTLETKEAAQ